MTDFLSTSVALLLLAVPAVTVPAALRIRGRAPFLIAVLVVAASVLVGITIALSVIGAWTRPAGLLSLVGVAVVAVAVWDRSGRMRPPMTRVPVWPLPIRGVPLALVAVAGLAAAVQLYVGLRVAPSNWDSMTYHLSRAAYWLQQQSAFHYAGASLRQSAYPPNAEILQAWTMLLTGTDRWVEIVQWIALVGLALAVYSGARMLHFAPVPAAFAGALFMVTPEPIMEAASTQNDLVTGLFVGATALFAVRGLRDRNMGDVTIAAVAIGLAVGTKGTALLAGVPLILIAIGAVICYRPGYRFVLASAAFAVAGILAFGSYNYILNYKDTHDLFGGVSTLTDVPKGTDRAQNATRDLWTLVDAPGFGAWIDHLVEPPAHGMLAPLAGNEFPFTVDKRAQEDTSAFGLVGWLVLPLVLFLALVMPGSPRTHRVVAGAVLAFFVLFGLELAFNPWLGRLMIPGVALGAPLLAVIAHRDWLALAVLGLALSVLVPTVFTNPQKPVLRQSGPGSTVFAWSRVSQMTAIRPEVAPALNRLGTMLQSGQRIGFAGGEDSWDYPLFGAHRERQVERFRNPAEATYERMERDGLRGVYFADVGPPPRQLRSIRLGPDYYWAPARQ